MSPLEQLPIPLLVWYRENARVLPWRTQPTPYRVWVSEIMLQQTRVAAVIAYFNRFMDALPTVEALAQVEEDALMKLWQGLGYYSRARNLQKAAREIMARHGGLFPNSYEDIRALPGVGDYTAGAVASIAFGLPRAAVDGNVLRVVTRINGDFSDVTLPATRRAVESALEGVMPLDAPGSFNQALMELGATVCLPNGAPLCQRCPAAPFCTALAKDCIQQLPVKPPKPPRRLERRTVYLIFRDNQVALRRREGRGLLSGLWEYPNLLQAEEEQARAWGLPDPQPGCAGRGKHIFTHIEWHMEAKIVETQSAQLPQGWVWADRAALRHDYAVPNAFRFVENLVADRLGRL